MRWPSSAASTIYKGLKRVMGPDQVEGARQRLAAGDKLARVARELGVSRQTVYAYLKS